MFMILYFQLQSGLWLAVSCSTYVTFTKENFIMYNCLHLYERRRDCFFVDTNTFSKLYFELANNQ